MHLPRTLPIHAPLTHIASAIVVAWLMALACATPAAAEITLSIGRPLPESLAESDPLEISVYVYSPPLEITSIQAAVGARTLALTKTDENRWAGSLPLTGLPRGQHQLVVTATNTAAETKQVTRTFIFNNPPTLTVTSPADSGDLLGPDVRVRASCVDEDSPPCRITVHLGTGVDPLLAAGIGAIDTIVPLPPGQPTLAIVAADAATNRTVGVLRSVEVRSPRQRQVASYSGGILDITTDRVLIVDSDVTPYAIRMVDRATNTSQIIWTGQVAPNPGGYEFLTYASLTVSGALFESTPGGSEARLHEWRGGTLVDLGTVVRTFTKVKGRWATFMLHTPRQLILRDLIAGTNTVVTDKWHGDDLAPDGRVFYGSESGEVMRFEPGPPPTTTQLTFDAPASKNYAFRTDGINLVFNRVPMPSTGPGSLILRTSGGEEIVLGNVAMGRSGDEYLVANGWIAFVRQGPGPDRTAELWLRAPDGTLRRLAVSFSFRYIQALSDAGEVIFNSDGQQYLGRPDGTVLDLGVLGRAPFMLDNAWHVISGKRLFTLDMTLPSRSILAEGATGAFFTTDVAILNPHDVEVPVTIRYLRENAPAIEETRTLPAVSRTTIHENAVDGLEHASVSTIVDAQAGLPVVAERLMTWDASGYGGHLGTSVDEPRLRWMFAEGAQGFFHTFFLLANSGDSEAAVTFTFLVEQGTPVTHTVTVAPGARKTIYAADVAGLVHRAFATVIESTVPIVAERAMYFGDSPVWLGGHGTAGVTAPAHQWYHAEGATGSLFDTFILLANPHPVDVPVRITYITDAGQSFERERTLPASSRVTINVEEESPELANAAVSTRIQSGTLPILSERAMYWGTTGAGWRDAHNSFGVTQTSFKWGLAEGRAGGPRAYQTFVLVSNHDIASDPAPAPANLRVTFVKEDGTKVVRPFEVPASRRLTIDTSAIPALANSNFATIVESTNGKRISVEGAIYWSVNGVTWEGGGNTVATPLR